MHRTLIYINDTDYHLLKKKAQTAGESFSQLVRDAIRFYLDKVVKRPSWEADSIWKLSGIGKADVSNTDSIDHDEILYGEKK
jgi:hypothetical protein